MKQLMAMALFVVSGLATQAQSGTVLLGGDVSFSSSSQDVVGGNSFEAKSLNLNPYVGYQFNDNWTAGVVGSILSSKSEQGANTSKTSEFAAGPFVRYTQPVSDLFWLYGQLEGKFGSRKSENNGVTFAESNSTTINLFPAAFINLKNSFGLNFNFGGLTYGSVKPDGGPKSNSFNLNFGKVATIGISKNFGASKK